MSPGKAVSLSVESDDRSLKANGADILQAEIRLLDANGNPAQDETVYVQTVGDLKMLGLENGLPDDLTPYGECWRVTREGTLTAYFRAGEIGKRALIHCWTASGLEADLRITLKA